MQITSGNGSINIDKLVYFVDLKNIMHIVYSPIDRIIVLFASNFP